MFGLGKKKKPGNPNLNPALGQAAVGDKKLYSAWSNWVRSMGGKPSDRLVEYMMTDLNQSGMAQNPNQPGSTVPVDEATAIRNANKDIDDAYTSAEIARDFSEKLRSLTKEQIKQVGEMTDTLAKITKQVMELQDKFITSPDFRSWTLQLERITTGQGEIVGKMDAIFTKAGELIKVFNEAIEEMGKLKDDIRTSVVGEIEQHIDRKIGADGLGDIRGSLTELIKANNTLIELSTKAGMNPATTASKYSAKGGK